MEWCSGHVAVAVIVLLLTGTGLRIGYRFMVERPERDEVQYAAIVDQAAAEGIETLSFHAQRLMIYCGVVLKKAGVESETGLRGVNFSASLLWLVVVFFLGRSFFRSDKAGLIALTLAVFNPYSIRISGQILREPLYLLIFSGGIFCALQILRGKQMIFFSALLGVLTVAGGWARIEGWEMLAWMPLALLFHFLQLRHRRCRVDKKRITAGCITYLCALCAAGSILLSVSPDYAYSLQNKAIACFRIK